MKFIIHALTQIEIVFEVDRGGAKIENGACVEDQFTRINRFHGGLHHLLEVYAV